MNLDKNSVIGMVLLALLFFGYFYFTRQGQIELEKKQKTIQDSLAAIQPVKIDSAVNPSASASDTAAFSSVNAGSFVQVGKTQEEINVLENNLVKISFSNKGAQPVAVELKKYRSIDSSNVMLAKGDFNRLSYLIQTGPNQTTSTSDLYFIAADPQSSDGASRLSFVLKDSSGKSIEHRYTLKPNEYMFQWEVVVDGADLLFPNKNINLVWEVQANQQELDIQTEKRETQLGLYGEDGFDYFTMSDGLSKQWESGLKWLGLKQKFFNSTVIADNGFSYADIQCNMPDDSTGIVAKTSANLRSTIPATKSVTLGYRFFIGPNEYSILKQYKLDMEDMVNLGQGFYAFVKYINRWIVLPAFGFFEQYFPSSMGLAIALLTIFIRLLTSPLVYTSYVSGAKMKALRPEIDQLKKKYGEDQQAFSMEQMKLFRTAGVNPLGGCIPALLQIPIFFALYSFFNSNINLRGVSFWWSKDLSSYDAIVTWGFNFPGVGNHLSLFTILAVITSLLISLYSMSMTPDQGNPVLKYMPYIFPVLLLGIFNGLPSALTWYYTVSNVITLVLQFVIQNYIIDHNKILAEIESNKKKPRTKSKWQERLEQMQETQKKVNVLKEKTKK